MIDWGKLQRGQSFTPAQVKAAIAAVNAMPADGGYIEPLWPPADKMAKIDQIDFGDAKEIATDLGSLFASTKRMKVSKLVVHLRMCVKAPGSPIRVNPFTAAPMTVCDEDGTVTILDGHHRLGALKILGATSWPTWQVPLT